MSAQLVTSSKSDDCEDFLDSLMRIYFGDATDEQVAHFLKLCHSLTWSHFIELIRVEEDLERQFYEVETLQNKWSVREMKRQIDSQLFARVCLSKGEEQVLQIARQGVTVENPEDLLKDPLVLEFLKLPEDNSFSESDLEMAIIDNLQAFLLEMGKGFCFVARQKRITFNTRHYYVDLLLYNRKLKSLVAVDLKVGEFDHADAGQMNFYLNYLKQEEMEEGENPPVGIILCASKDQAFVEFALGGLDNQVFVSKYQLYLPTKEQLQELIEKTKQRVYVKALPSSMTKAITALELSQKVINCLRAAGIDKVGDLVARAASDLMKIRGFGKVSLKRVVDSLAKMGLALQRQD